MATRRERILGLLVKNDGLTDREITRILEGDTARQQPINKLCREMAENGVLVRTNRGDGRLGNYLVNKGESFRSIKPPQQKPQDMITPFQLTKKNASRGGDKLNKLITLGFEQVGQWFWATKDLNFELVKHYKEKNILYAFVVDGEVKYIGKTSQTLHKRIYLYKICGPTQRTNIRVREKIRACLKNGAQVLIYAFVQKTPMMYKDIPINLAAGLEDNIISSIRPEWNIR